MPLRPGDAETIGGYTLTDRLGSGGMGIVYLGRSASGRQVAVKVVHPPYAQDEEFRTRFRQEIAAARQVSGAFTAPVVDADPDAEQPWMATLYVPGRTLSDVVAEDGPLAGRELRTLALGLVEALRDIHRAGVVHRDLKPSNVLIAEDGPRVIDFGVSHAVDNEALTVTGRLIGTPPFMSPEQFASPREVTAASDVFSLGSVLVYAATGTRPFDGSSPYLTGYQVMYEAPALDGVAEPLRSIAERCLAKDPAARPDVADLHRMILTLPESTGSPESTEPPVSPVSPVSPEPPTSAGSPASAAPVASGGRPARQGRRGLRVLIGLVAVLVVTGLSFTLMTTTEETEEQNRANRNDGSPSPTAPTSPSASASAPASRSGSGPTPGSGSAAVVLPPKHVRWDYQIGGAYTLPAGVRVVSRSHEDPAAPGAYNICNVNALQAQEDAEDDWDSDLLLRDADGEVVRDEDWNEAVLDIRTAAKRQRIASRVNAWIDECAAKGYQAVEPDNYDTFTRFPDHLTAGQAKAFMRLLSAHAHEKGLAVAQKNTLELAPDRASVGMDFAVVEECGEWDECGDFAKAFDDNVFVVEYTAKGLANACEGWGGELSIVRRDENVVPEGTAGHLGETC
ncbi:endo alpha-1,4 polygalactosaminidase [Streptomyces akebiae]|uniref:Endo alpha-1,4 polygalactosaminidase n=1 Tax=Streptomyces akebiae TaxID=2865673 RepID=A0ABX8XS32_9ACTN|nr:endo alpha-1,4 polygalactosaminidase [Streptomyces akebiae]QYX78624.1 endo alpha-1,4 polygalactosaminidase [Streptomyces akebiae]